MKNKLKIKWINIILILIILTCLTIFTKSLYEVIVWKKESNEMEEQIEEIQQIIEIEEVIETEDNDIEITPQEEDIEEANPYWDYINMNLINIDFSELQNINNDTKGWIQVNGTNINYPFVQSKDNKYYLKHSYDKSYNTGGWIFLDYRNNINSLDKNTIIYGHSRKDKTMFGSLKNILKSGWLNDTDNYIVKLSTEATNTLWQVFSVYHIPTTNDYIKVNFNDNAEFKEWTDMLINRSAHDFKTKVNENDNVLTLSTCYNEKEKVVLHAKLIKKETR